jgi:hypothetical protein
MAITKKPAKQPTASDREADAFIAKAGNPLALDGKTPVLFPV